MTLEIKETHDCQTPDMSTGEKVYATTRTGVWPFRKDKQWRTQTWDKRQAKWTCPVCESRWSYSGAYGEFGQHESTWKCEHRTYVWEKVPEPLLTS